MSEIFKKLTNNRVAETVSNVKGDDDRIGIHINLAHLHRFSPVPRNCMFLSKKFFYCFLYYLMDEEIAKISA